MNWHSNDIIQWHFEGNSATDIVGLYQASYPAERWSCKATVNNIIRKFKDHNTLGARRVNNKWPVNGENHFIVCQSVIENPRRSLHNIEANTGIHFTSVRFILRKNNFKPYRFSMAQPLTDVHIAARLEFCERVIPALDIYPELASHICFTDKSSFGLLRSPNRQNVRYWCLENPHTTFEKK